MGRDEEKQPTLETVERRLDALKKSRGETSAPATPAGYAARAAIDFASACAVGCLLGYGVDHWLGTSPWGILIGSVIGTITGFKLMWQVVQRDLQKNAADVSKE